MRSRLLSLFVFLGLSLLGMLPARAVVPWFAMGPYGGDARSIAQDPSDSRHLFLGTATGWVYESHDGGRDWKRLAQIAKRDDLVVDHILIDPRDPKHLMVGTWVVDRPEGGLFVSIDGGRTWYDQAQMRGQSIRSLARSGSNPDLLVAGTLQGVFRSADNGVHWVQISPVGSTEIHEIESIAIDPVDTNVIYAGTWHLPWKTTDGGEHWENIKNGVIDDSDVFSIIIDPDQPRTVYASACSGIYKSLNAGAQFRKINGIPSTARRTRKLTQDPSASKTVYAGTTEGLYRTQDAGASWSRLTGPDVIVNDVWVDPKNSHHLLLATDRGGVLSSEDDGVSFQQSNIGFSARQVVSYAADTHTGAIYVGVVNDKTTGGVFASLDGGLHWEQQSQGLGGRDVFSLIWLPGDNLLAGTNHGIFRFSDGEWKDSSVLLPASVEAKPVAEHVRKPVAKKAPVARRGRVTKKPVAWQYGSTGAGYLRLASFSPASTQSKAASSHSSVRPKKPEAAKQPDRLDVVVYKMERQGDAVFAGTTNGLLRSIDAGASWTPVTALAMPEVRFLGTSGKMILAGTLKRLALSVDAGKSWDTVALPQDLTQIGGVAVDEMNNLWVGGREGVYFSSDLGANWKTLKNLFITQVDDIYSDASGHRVLVTSSTTPFAFSVALPDYKVSYAESGWNLRFARPVGDHLIGASLFDGMVIQPRMVVSQFTSEPGK